MGRTAAKRAASERLNSVQLQAQSGPEHSRAVRSALAPKAAIRKPHRPASKIIAEEPIYKDHKSDFHLPATEREQEDMLQQHEYAVQDAQQFLAQLRKHSRNLQTTSKRNNHNALLCEGLYALVLDLLKLYAERKINQHQVVAGLRNVLRRHKQVGAALTNLLQVLHSRINKESSPSTATEARPPAGYQPSAAAMHHRPPGDLPRIGATLEPFPQAPEQPTAQPSTSQSSAVTSGMHAPMPAPIAS